MSCRTDLCQMISVLLQIFIDMSCRTNLCQMISLLLQIFVDMSCRTDLCQMISVLLQTIVNSTKHFDKSFTYRVVLPWLGTGLLTSTGETDHYRSTKMYDKYEICISQFAECQDCSLQRYNEVYLIWWIYKCEAVCWIHFQYANNSHRGRYTVTAVHMVGNYW